MTAPFHVDDYQDMDRTINDIKLKKWPRTRGSPLLDILNRHGVVVKDHEEKSLQ